MIKPQDELPVILIVEDEALTIMDLSDIFFANGYETLQSASAERAINLLNSHPEIIGMVTDVELSSKIDGFELARTAKKIRPDLPIVIVSGRSKPSDGRMPSSAQFLARPCRGEDIINCMNKLISRS